MIKTLRNPSFALAVASLSLGSVAFTQTSPPSTSASAGSGETIQLTEFTVSEKSLDGYIASESVTGTRVATQIKDLPFAISVITSG